MPQANFGEKTNADRRGGFIKLKDKGETFRIRFIRPDFFYDGKHFTELADHKWDIQGCPRINEDNYCDTCEKAQEILSTLNGVKDENERKAIKEKAKPFQPSISFYYPVIDRADETAKILQVSMGIRIKLEERLKKGEEVLKYDYDITRTEKPGSEYYTLERVDSAETKELTEREKVEVADAIKWDLSKMVEGRKSDLELDNVTEAEKVFAEGGVEIPAPEEKDKPVKTGEADEIHF